MLPIIFISTAILLAIVTQGVLLLMFLRRVRNETVRAAAAARAELIEFVSPGQDGSASPLAIVCNQLAAEAGKTLAVQLKMALMGKIGAASRALDSAEGEAALAQQPPLMAGLLGMLGGKTAGKLAGSPLITNLLGSLAAGMAAKAGSNLGNNGNGDRPHFHLGGM